MPVPVKSLTETLLSQRINKPIRSVSGLVDVFSQPLNRDTFAINFEPVNGVSVDDQFLVIEVDGCIQAYPCNTICGAVEVLLSLNVELLWKEDAYKKVLFI